MEICRSRSRGRVNKRVQVEESSLVIGPNRRIVIDVVCGLLKETVENLATDATRQKGRAECATKSRARASRNGSGSAILFTVRGILPLWRIWLSGVWLPGIRLSGVRLTRAVVALRIHAVVHLRVRLACADGPLVCSLGGVLVDRSSVKVTTSTRRFEAPGREATHL
jgi:hypothetical protein